MSAVKQAVCKLKSTSPYSQSRHIEEPKKNGENAIDYEARTWRLRLHTDKAGHIFIPAMAFTNSLAEAAKYLSMPIPGDRQKTFTKHFEAGVRVIQPLTLPLKAKDVDFDELFVPSDGKRGGGKRVTKYFPRIDAWEGTVTYWIADPVITEEAFTRAIHASGTLIGIGRFRPKNLGYYGMFEVKDIKWVE